MALIAQHQQTAFADPQNGQSPMDASVVRNNDNATRAKLNAHDADATIHVQSGTLAARPAASTLNAMYMDENLRLYRDSGAVWVEVPYARLDAAGTNAFANNITVGGSLVVTGSITGGSIIGPSTVAATNVTPGTFPSGTYTFQTLVNVQSLVASSNVTATGAVSATAGISTAGTLAVTGLSRTVPTTTLVAIGGSITGTLASNMETYDIRAATDITLRAGVASDLGATFIVRTLRPASGSPFDVTFAGANFTYVGASPPASLANGTERVYQIIWGGGLWMIFYLGTATLAL